MSAHHMRHHPTVPAGYAWPASVALDAWEERTTVLPPSVLAQALVDACRTAYRPAWTYAHSGLSMPSRQAVLVWARMLCALRSPARIAYARAWVAFCLSGGFEAPCHLAHGLAHTKAVGLQRDFAEAGLFDPRDFAEMPF